MICLSKTSDYLIDKKYKTFFKYINNQHIYFIQSFYIMESLPEFGFEEGLYDLKDLQFLGSGTYGKVYRSKILKTAQPIAIKQINMTTINNQGLVHSLKQ